MTLDFEALIPEEFQPQDKIHVTTILELPHECIICSKSADGERRFIDFDFSMDYYGAVYICEECIRPVAYALRFVEVEKLKYAVNELRLCYRQMADKDKEIERYKALIDSLNSMRPDLLNDPVVPPSLESETSTADDSGVTINNPDEGKDDSGSNESTPSRRSKNLPFS